MGPTEWGSVVSTILTGLDARERDVARWRACAALAGELKAYVPAEPVTATGEPLEPAYDVRSVALLTRREDIYREIQGRPDVCQGLSAWRISVTDAESLSARRLLVLGSSVAWLAGLLAREPRDRDRVVALCDSLGRWVHEVWRCDVPFNADLRQWAIKSTRRYDLLTSACRSVALSQGLSA